MKSPHSLHAPKSASPNRILIGPAGWSYPDWAGYVYPAPRSKGFHKPTYLSEYFDTIEINTSFYHPRRSEHAASWIERVSANPGFLFTAKLWQKFTHDPSATEEDEKAVRAGFDLLQKTERLGAILLQFPFSFHRSEGNGQLSHCCPKEIRGLSSRRRASSCLLGVQRDAGPTSRTPCGPL